MNNNKRENRTEDWENWTPEMQKIYKQAMERAKVNKATVHDRTTLENYGIGVDGVEYQQQVDSTFSDAVTTEEKRRALLLAAAADDLVTAKKLREEHDRERGEIIARQNNQGCWSLIKKSFNALATGE